MKKKIWKLLVLIFSTSQISLYGQAPQKISFQAVVRNISNVLLSNQSVGMRINILQGSLTGTIIFTETHNPTTNGLVTIDIGGGMVITGAFANINWANGPYFIKTETDPTGGNNYTIIGTQQLLSVPYALYAEKSGTLGPKGNDGISIINTQVINDSLKITLSNSIIINAGYLKGSVGINGVSVINVQAINDSLKITLSNSQIINAGRIKDFTHYIGERFGGGIVYHIFKDSSGEHGLIVSLMDLNYIGNFQVWSNVSSTLIGIGAQSTWHGQANTNAIIAQTGHTTSAAYSCDTFNSGAFTDWYLPSADEMNLLYHARYNVNKALSTIAGTDQFRYSYWTSTEYTDDRAFNLNANVGSIQAGTSKSTLPFVRAIRKF